MTLAAAPTTTPGCYATSFPAGAPGDYRAQATARRGAFALGGDRREFEVTEPLGELTDAARPQVLAAIAEATGGRVLPLEQAAELSELLPLPTVGRTVNYARPGHSRFPGGARYRGRGLAAARRWGVG